MGVPGRVVWVALGAAVALAGIALGAEFQEEGFLPPDTEEQNRINQGTAPVDPVPLTGLLVGLGVAGVGGALAHRRITSGRPAERGRALLERAGTLAALGLAAYLLANLVQTAFPTVSLIDTPTLRRGSFAINLLASNSPAIPSALTPVFGAVLATLLVVLWALKRLAVPPPQDPWGEPGPQDGVGLLHDQVGTLLLATPFLGLSLWGCLRLVVETPDGPVGDPYRIVLPLVALALLGLLATASLKAYQVARYLREPRTAPLCEEAWGGLGRTEAWLVGFLLLLAASASLFRPVSAPLLETGGTFGSDLRRHLQLLLLVLVPLAPGIRLHRAGLRLFSGPPGPAAGPSRTWVVACLGAVGASLLAAGAATLAIQGPLAGWLLASLPVAMAGVRLRSVRLGSALLLVTAWSAWGLGNSMVARYDPTDAGLIQFQGSPGALALWRLLGAILAGLAAARLARSAGRSEGARVAWPLAGTTGLCIVAIAFLELPLSIWTDSSSHGQVVALGSSLASQDPPVQAVLHAVALAAGVAAALMVARLCRPEWFQRTRRARAWPSARPRPLG
jgi:hypothetical protein